MKSTNSLVAMLVVCLFLAPTVWAQAPASENQSAASPAQRLSAAEVPRLIKFSGTLLDVQERPMAGPVGVTFALYSQQTGGAALWVETQNVKPDASGAYVVLLGANSTNGVPAELFVSGEARWLGIQVGQQPERERILLVSVPYALKAGDAETLGGLPASAFVTTGVPGNTGNAGGAAGASSSSSSSTGLPKSSAATTPKKAAASTPQPATACTSLTSDGTATTNSFGLFTAPCNLQGSVMLQTLINGFPGVNVAGNNAGLLLNGTGTHQITVTGLSSGRLGQDATGFFFSSDTSNKVIKFLTNNGTLNEWMRITSAGNVGIGTTAPGAKLDILGDGVNSPAISVSGSGNTGGSGESSLLLKTTNTGGPTTWSIRAGSSNSIRNLRFGTASVPDMINITPAGNVGIGVASPASFYKLQVAAGANPVAIFGQTSATGGFFAIGGESDSTTSIGVLGQNFGGGGLPGFDTFNIGVSGQSNNGIGVDGSVETGVAVRGRLGNAAGKLFSGLDPSGTEKFSVDSSGNVTVGGTVKFPDGTAQTTSAGASHTITIVASVGVTPGNFANQVANCPSGFHAIGGGVDLSNVLTMVVTQSAPFFNGTRLLNLPDGQNGAATGWAGAALDNGTANETIKVGAICAPD